jgi:hypothetical protein
VTTQSPHPYARGRTGTVRSAAGAAPASASAPASAGTATPAAATDPCVQTRLPWWALALPALAFAALLALLTGGTADASDAASSGGWLARFVLALPDLFRHLM